MGRRLIAVLLLAALSACANQQSPSVVQPSSNPDLPLPPVKPPVPKNWAQSTSAGVDGAKVVHLSAADFECMAQAIYFEAGNEIPTGQRAIADVILNRLHDPRFPKTVCDIIHDGAGVGIGHCQFSWFCDGRSDETSDEVRWQMAEQAATEVLSGEYPDWTKGALYFHNKSVKPPWRKRLLLTNVIGNHIFYRDPA